MFFRPNGSTKLAKRPKNIQHDQNVPNTMCENNASGSHEVEKNTTKKKKDGQDSHQGLPVVAARGCPPPPDCSVFFRDCSAPVQFHPF